MAEGEDCYNKGSFGIVNSDLKQFKKLSYLLLIKLKMLINLNVNII